MPQCQNSNTRELYICLREKLLTWINSRVQDPSVAEDLLHDTFERIEKYCQGGGTCAYPKSYVFQSVINRVRDHLKTDYPNISLEEACIPSPPIALADIEPSNKPNLEYFLAGLSPENRQAFLWVDYYKIPQTQVAQCLGIPLSTLKSRVQRTRRLLQKKFRAYLEHSF